MNLQHQELSLGKTLGMKIANLLMYEDGFSFTVDTEQEAYKAAYKYQGTGIQKTVVREAPNANAWSVQIYKTHEAAATHIKWWIEVGSAFHPLENEDCEEFAQRVTALAWNASRGVIKTASASKVLRLLDEDVSYCDAVAMVMSEDNISREQLEKELEPFI